MPVQTRSQRKSSEHELQNIEITINNSGSRLVKFTTPDKTNIINNCPSTPRAPRASKKIYQSFGSVIRKLDFNTPRKREQYPLNYKNFIIANKFQKKKVDEFLSMINGYLNDKSHVTNKSKEMIKLRIDQISNLSDNDLLEMATTLNSNTKFWTIFNENIYGETTLNSAVYYWANLLASIVLIYLSRIVISANISPLDISREIITNKIIPGLITFKNVFVNENFPRFSSSRRFLGTIMQKMMQFGNSGYVLSVLVIRHYYPHMVSKECYPFLNVFSETGLYHESLEYTHSSTQPDIVRLFKECKPIYNFD